MFEQNCPKNIPTCFKVTGVYCISFGEYFYIGSSKNVQNRISQHRKKLRKGVHQKIFQSCYWLFGEEKMKISLLEKCDFVQLKSREKYWINTLKPNINHDRVHNTNPSKIVLNGKGSKKVYQYTIEGKYVTEFPSVMEASRYLGVDSRGIGLCADKNRSAYKSAYGYRWSYVKYDKLPEYINNSSKAVNREIFVFDVLTGEEKRFQSVAEAVRFYNPNVINFDSDCASLCHCANDCGYYLNRYCAKNSNEDAYKLTKKNVHIYNSVKNKLYPNAKEASKDCNISDYLVKKYCKEEDNKEWLFINQCARVKLRESGKLFE